MKLLRLLLSNRDLAYLEAAWAATSLGTWALSILLALYAYGEGGTNAVAIAALARMLPSALAAPYAAALADRHSRRGVLLATVVARAALMAAISVALLADAPFALVLAITALFTIAGTAHKPAQAALAPQLARTPAELAAVNVYWSAIDCGAFLTGSLLAGVLAAAASLHTAFLLCALPFVLAAGALSQVRADQRPPDLVSADQRTLTELLAGFRAVAGHPQLRLLVGMFSADMLVQAMVDVLLVVAALELLDLGASGVGWLSAAWGVGGVASAVAATALVRRGRLASGLALGCLLAGLPLVALAVWPEPVPALALLVVLGVGFALQEVALLTLTQRLVADEVLGRVYGVQETMYVFATATGAVAAAALVGVLGAEGALIVTGVVLPGLALALRRSLETLEAGADVPEREFSLLRGLSVFAPLPIATLENLALRAETVRFPSGATIVRQGEPGDTFFVIEDGTVEVRVDGSPRRHQAAGEFFGEIALLKEIPRTATVRAATPTTALAIGREEFLASINSHARSSRDIEQVTSQRLEADRARRVGSGAG